MRFALLLVALVLVPVADASAADGAWDRAWGKDVVAGNAETGFEVCLVAAACQAGDVGSPQLGAELAKPSGVAVAANGNVYVPDTGGHRVVVFDRLGNFLRTWGLDVIAGNAGTGPEICTVLSQCKRGATPTGPAGGGFQLLESIAIDGAGSVYVTDEAARVLKFDSSGNFLRAWGGDMDKGTAGGNALEVCTVEAQCGTFGVQSGFGGPFTVNLQVAASQSGVVSVLEARARVAQFDSNGTFLRIWGKDVVNGNAETGVETCTVLSQCKAGTNGDEGGAINGLRAISTDAAGNVYVGDQYRVQKLGPTGVFQLAFGKNVDGASAGTGFETCTTAATCLAGELGTTGGAFDDVWGVAVDGDGFIYTSEGDNRRIQKFGPTGAFVKTWGKGVAGGAGFETCTTVDGCAGGTLGAKGGEISYDLFGVGANPVNGRTVYTAEQLGHRVQAFGARTPVLTATAPSSPANDNQPEVTGNAQDGATVSIYATSTCTGPVLATGSAAALTSAGITVPVADDSTTTFYAKSTAGSETSDCSSAGLTYVEDSAPPATPAITSTVPASPNPDVNPKLVGTAEAGSTVRLFTTAGCSLPVVATGAASTFASPGIGVNVAPDSATTFYANATDAAGNVSACSAGVTYVAREVDTRIVSGPVGPTPVKLHSFGFVADPAPGSTFECSLDNATFAACPSPFATPALPDGPHSFAVRTVTSEGLRDATPATRSFFVDTVAPAASVRIEPRTGFGARISGERYSGTVSLGRDASDPEPSSGLAEIRCALDPASPPASIDAIPTSGCPLITSAPGTHTFWVATRDNAGNASPPQVATFTIAGPPDTTITFGPTGDTWNSTPSFAFTSTTPGSTFVCRMDNIVVACGSSYVPASPLAQTGHVFSVAAVSPEGVADPTPATRSFRVAQKETVSRSCTKQVGRVKNEYAVVPYPQGTPISITKSTFGGYNPDAGCTLELDPCPLRAKCTVRASMRFDEADETAPPPGFDGVYGWLIAWSAGVSVYGSYVGTTPTNFATYGKADGCLIKNSHSAQTCSADATTTTIGSGTRPIVAACHAGHEGYVAPNNPGNRDAWGPDDQRRITCNISVIIEPAATLETTTGGETMAIYVSDAGSVDITPPPTPSGRATAAASKKPKRAPAFKPIRTKVKAAGPVTFKLALSKEAAKIYKAKGKLRLTIKATFTPLKGKKISRRLRITLVKPTAPKKNGDDLRALCRKDKKLQKLPQCRKVLG